MKLEVSNRWKTGKCINVWKVNNTAEQLSNNESGRTGNVKGSILSKEIETVIKYLPKSREELTWCFLNSTIIEEGTLSNLCYNVS